jgi:hypothetical protein
MAETQLGSSKCLLSLARPFAVCVTQTSNLLRASVTEGKIYEK